MKWLWALALVLAPASVNAHDPLTLERSVVVYRHGVRAPLEPEAALDGIEHAPLPDWPVAPSLLTPHGTQALTLIGLWRAAQWREAGLWPAQGCPGPHDLAIWTNTAARTIASGAALAQGLAPGCPVAIGHLDAGQSDPLFEPMHVGLMAFDSAKALASVQAATGGTARLTRALAQPLRRLGTVIGCDTTATPCDLAADAGTVTASEDGHDLSLTGSIRRTSGTAQVLLLEYLEGLPPEQVGWGRASAQDLRDLGALHAALFDVLARPPYLAARIAGPLARRIAATLADPAAPRATVLVGHDTNIAALASLIGVSVAAPGYAPGDPPPGGALGFDVLRDPQGRRWVRVTFEAASPAQIRALTRFDADNKPARITLAIAGCATRDAPELALCPLKRVLERIDRRAAPFTNSSGHRQK